MTDVCKFNNEDLGYLIRQIYNYISMLGESVENSSTLDINIPTTNGYVKYLGYPKGGIATRNARTYANNLGMGLDNSEKEKLMEMIFGNGKVIVDLGSGLGVALLEFWLKYPSSSIIGIDINYQTQSNAFPTFNPGLELINGDWDNLFFIPDSSVDHIISVAGKGLHGIKYQILLDQEGCEPVIPDKIYWLSNLQEYYRILKPGGELRFSQRYEVDMTLLADIAKENGWEVLPETSDWNLALRRVA